MPPEPGIVGQSAKVPDESGHKSEKLPAALLVRGNVLNEGGRIFFAAPLFREKEECFRRSEL